MARAHHRRHYRRHYHHRARNPRRRGYLHFARNPRRHYRVFARRRHRNPILGMSTSDMLTLGGGAVVGGVITRWAPQTFLKDSNTGIMGYGANAITAVAGGWLVSKLSPRWGQGFVIGGLAALGMRIVTDFFGPQVATLTGGGVSGDLDFDLGFYIPNSFPTPTAGSGPWLLNPGYEGGQPMASFVLPSGQPVVVPAAQAPAVAAAGGKPTNHVAAAAAAAPAAAAIDTSEPGRWRSRWAA